MSALGDRWAACDDDARSFVLEFLRFERLDISAIAAPPEWLAPKIQAFDAAIALLESTAQTADV